MSRTAESLRVHVNGAEGAGASPGLLRHAVLATLSAEGVEAAEISLTLLDDDGMAELNRRYLDRSGPTDVLAFALGDEGAPPLGDVYLGTRQALAQATRHGVSPAEELVRLAVHGTLHVLGWDHPEGPERTESPMFRRQEELVDRVRNELPVPPDA